MSTLSAKSQRWRRLGLLKYLAVELGVSVKQVTRYWDRRWILNRYRTPGGGRRVRYNDDTVEQVRRNVRAAKDTNIHIRYRLRPITYCGTVISVEGCNSMDDLYRRARKAGLSKRDASLLAYRQRLHQSMSSEDVAWDALLALKGTSEREIDAHIRQFDCIPIAMLIESENAGKSKLIGADNAEEFRRRAEAAGQQIQSSFDGMEEAKTTSIIRDLLSQKDLRSFVRRLSEVTELENRIMDTDGPTFYKAHETAVRNPGQLRLPMAASRLKHQQCRRPSALALARVLNLSRPALYRAFGAKAIQDALKAVRYDPVAAAAKRNDKWAEGKKNKQGTRTTLRDVS
jgi:DNA-binding transcriptional MerR regulator